MFNGNNHPGARDGAAAYRYRNGVDHYAYSDGTRRYVTVDLDGGPWPYCFLGDGHGNGYDHDAPSTGCTVIELSVWPNLLGYPRVDSDTLELAEDSERDGGYVVSDALDAMSEYAPVQDPEHLQRVFQRWADRGIVMRVLNANQLSAGPFDPCHALPRDGYLLVGDDAPEVAETARQWAAGDVYRVWAPTPDELAEMTDDELDLDDLEESDLLTYVADHVGGVYFTRGTSTADEVRGVI